MEEISAEAAQAESIFASEEPVNPTSDTSDAPEKLQPASEFEDASSASSEDFQIGVSDPEKVGEGMNSYMAYQITVKTSHPGFSQSEFTMVRRYSDFEWLRTKLADRFRGVVVPPLPEKAVINRFNKEFVTYRRKELERFLKRIVQHKLFIDAEEFKAFFQPSEDVFAKAKTAKKEGEQKKGFMSFLTEKVTSVQAAIGKPEEIDNWFEEQKTYLNTLETQLHQLLNRASVISSHSRAISTSWASLGQASNALQSCELDQDKVLATFYGKLTEVSNQVSALEKELAENETEYFEDSMKDYIRIIGATKDVLSNRSTDLWHYQQATKSREGQADKLEKGRGTSKEASLADQLRESEGKEKEARDAFDAISLSAREQLSQFKKSKNVEISESLRRLVQLNMNHHLRVVDLWKEMLVDIEEVESAAQ